MTRLPYLVLVTRALLGRWTDGTAPAIPQRMDLRLANRIPTPTFTGRSTTFVLVTELAGWKRMKRTKSWRAFGKGGMVLTVGFEASPETIREMAREVLKTTGWCLVRADLTATW